MNKAVGTIADMAVRLKVLDAALAEGSRRADALAGELHGQVHLDYLSEGLSCRMCLPMQTLEPTE
jgi:hypothetical protein